MDCLELDCGGKVEPNMKAYRPIFHDSVLFDQASVDLVIRAKKLFQAPLSYKSLGSSGTNCYSYDVWCHRTKFIVSSNKWEAELQEARHVDADWLRKNSVYVRIAGPMWVDDDAELAASLVPPESALQ